MRRWHGPAEQSTDAPVGPKQLTDATTKTLMMLPLVPSSFYENETDFSTDMCLIQDKSFKQYAQKYAKSEDEFFKEYVSILQ